MKRLIKADLTTILRLAGDYRPIEAARLDTSVSRLCDQEFSDYLFLAWRNWCGLFDLPAVYEKDSYANLCWTACRINHREAVIALFLHVEKVIEGQPWGSVTILDYRAAVEDIEASAPLSQDQREQHIKQMTRRYLRDPQYGSIMEIIQHLRKAGECQWT